MKISDPPSLASDTTGCKARTALYFGACSRPAGADQTPEPENQYVRLREFAAAMGWTIVAEFTDNEAAAMPGRTQFQTMMAAASKREFDVILVWSLRHFGDVGIYKTLQHLNTLARYDVGFRSFREPFIDTTGESGDLLRSLFSFFAAFERQQIGERVRAGHGRVRAQGKHIGRPRATPDTNLLAKIRALHAAGHSIREIAKILDIGRNRVKRIAAEKELREQTRNVLKIAIGEAQASNGKHEF
jgi:DNA invertase Pin-like site-specific DNA recombinase